MLSAHSETGTSTTTPLPSSEDVEQLHESARERIRTILKRTQPIVVDPALADAAPPGVESEVTVAPEVAPIPAAPRELPSPYESDAADEEVDLHESARKRIRKITQPVEVPLPVATPQAPRPETARAAGPRISFRRPLHIAGALFGLLLLAGILNWKLIASAFNYDDFATNQIRQLSPELGGGYVVRNPDGGQFIGYLLRDSFPRQGTPGRQGRSRPFSAAGGCRPGVSRRVGESFG